MEIKSKIEITLSREEIVKIVNEYLMREKKLSVKSNYIQLKDISDDRFDRFPIYTLDGIKFEVETCH